MSFKSIACCNVCSCIKPPDEKAHEWSTFTTRGIDSRYTAFEAEVCPPCWAQVGGDPARVWALINMRAASETFTVCDGCLAREPVITEENKDGPQWIHIAKQHQGVYVGGIDFCPLCWKRGKTEPTYIVDIIETAYQKIAKIVAKNKAAADRGRRYGYEIIKELGG